MSGFTHEPGAGGTPEWYTPPWLFERLGLQFDLDPCAPARPKAPWIPADTRYSLPHDGLTLPWEGRVWLNPPYGTETGRWVGKLAEHGDGVSLTFSRVDTPWAQSAIRMATAVCFALGRVEFLAGDNAAVARSDGRSRSGAPSMLLAFGEVAAIALAKAELGVMVKAMPLARAELELDL